jgi:hypothetical protein
VRPWEGFTSYRGEIPFDGVSMSKTMRLYGAVLAVSSPAHMKSMTSSSRVFEATAAGVPVISDRNPHVQALFGDTVYYFEGETSSEKAAAIAARLKEIEDNPEDAAGRVAKAQSLMRERFCFEPCYTKALGSLQASRVKTVETEPVALDVFLFHHDLNPEGKNAGKTFGNAAHVAHAVRCAVEWRGARARVFCCAENLPPELVALGDLGVRVELLSPADLGLADWDATRLGRKVARLARKSDSDLTAFFSQFDHVHYDHFTHAIDAFNAAGASAREGLRIAGFYVNDFEYKKLPLPDGILRVNRPASMYNWSQDSFAEHDLGALIFSRAARTLLDEDAISPFDAILACALVALATVRGLEIQRSPQISLRVAYNNFQRHFVAWQKVNAKGLWAQHYNLTTNFIHEINGLYDLLHETREGVAIADAVSGRNRPAANAIADADTRVVAKNIRRVQSIFRGYHNLRKKLGLKRD